MKRVWAVTGATIAVAVLPWVVSWSSLPDPVATHWDASGDPNGHLPPLLAFAVLGGVAVVLAIGSLVAARMASPLPRFVAAGPILAFVAAMLAVTSASTVAANRDAVTWQDAHLPLGWIVVALLAGLAAGAVAATVQRVAPMVPEGPPRDAPVSMASSWVGSGHARWPIVVAAVLGPVGAVLVFLAPLAGWIMLLVAVLGLEFSVVHVTIDASGVRVAAPLGRPSVRFPMDQITAASGIDLKPMEWGGWGYRGSVRVFRRAAWVVRGGDGLRLDLQDGRLFAVSVDGAAEAAAAVNGLLRSTPR